MRHMGGLAAPHGVGKVLLTFQEESMVALIAGIVFVAFAIFACVPGPLGWWASVIAFLKGSLPVLALFIGLIAIFIGIADIKDRIEAKKEEEEEAKEAAAKSSEKKE